MLTLKDIQKEVEKIRQLIGDQESAHVAEDYLYRSFIEHIAVTGTIKQRKMAKAVLKTQKIVYTRWYA